MSWRPVGWDPDWREAPGTPAQRIQRFHRLNWQIMLKHGLRPGSDTECGASFLAVDRHHAEQVAPLLVEKGLLSVEVSSYRTKIMRRLSWWVGGQVIVPQISLEALDAAGLPLLALADEVGCTFTGLLPFPSDD